MPERSEGEERSDESTPLLGTNQIQLNYYVSSNHSRVREVRRSLAQDSMSPLQVGYSDSDSPAYVEIRGGNIINLNAFAQLKYI